MTLIRESPIPAFDEAARRLVETRDAFWALKLPSGIMRGSAREVARLRTEMFAAQRAYRVARDARDAEACL